MIELGLTRIRALLRNRPLPWKAIHVAGTNGKGSVCAYITAMLRTGGVRCGRFTSPHLIDRWDCIDIDGKPITYDAFNTLEEFFKTRNTDEKIGASEFELLTACAFEAFTRSNVEVGVVEVGLGGRLDATNILKDPLATVITKIGLDHQAFLGDTLEEIAKEKAGILKPGVPCVVNANNTASVKEVIGQVAEEVGAGPVKLAHGLPRVTREQKLAWTRGWGPSLRKWDKFVIAMRSERAQRENVACAVDAVKLAWPKLDVPKRLSSLDVLPVLMNTRLPGRLQTLDISPLVGREQEILLDGAHNADAAVALNVKAFKAYRNPELGFVIGIRDDYIEGKSLTWVLAFTAGKDVKEILRTVLRPHDTVVLTEFSPVDGMPWVKAMQRGDIESPLKELFPTVKVIYGGTTQQALQKASDISDGEPFVVAGSLYLVSDVLKLFPQGLALESDEIIVQREKRLSIADRIAATQCTPKRPPGRPKKRPVE